MCEKCEPKKDWIGEETFAYLNRFHRPPELPSDADVLHSMGEEIIHCSRCKCGNCANTIKQMRATYPAEQLSLAEEFVNAPAPFRFKALMGGWSGQQIAEYMLWNNLRRAA